MGSFWGSLTGQDARNTQSSALRQARKLNQQGTASTKAASNYWNKWLSDPTAAYNATASTAQNIGGAQAGQAVNSAINAARGSGLNAGQAALAGGAQAANAFTQGVQGAQNTLINNQQQSASGQSNQGLSQQNASLGAKTTVAGQQQGATSNLQTMGMNALGQGVGTLFQSSPTTAATS